MTGRIVGFVVGLSVATAVASITLFSYIGFAYNAQPAAVAAALACGSVALVAYFLLIFWCVALAQLTRAFPGAGSLLILSIAASMLIVMTLWLGGVGAIVIAAWFVSSGGLLAALIFFAPKAVMTFFGYVGGAVPLGSERFWRGINIGVNCSYSMVVALILYGTLFTIVGGLVAALVVLAASVAVLVWPEDPGVKLAVGTLAPLLPGSWFATTLGGMFFLIGMAGHWISVAFAGTPTFARWFRVTAVTVSAEESSIAITGGLPANLNLAILTVSGPLGYNLGLFLMLHGFFATPASLFQHEAGHHLNLAAFGGQFHFLGWFDEIRAAIVGPGPQFAYSERLAEGNVAVTTRPTVSMWR